MEASTTSHAPGVNLLKWLRDNGAEQSKVALRTLELPAAGRPLDVTVASTVLQPGDVALSVPEHLVVTLNRIFESDSNLGERQHILWCACTSNSPCLTFNLVVDVGY